MSRYVAVLKQADQGCDYTIACGVQVLDLGEHEDAVKACAALLGSFELGVFYDYHLAADAERRLESVNIFEVASSHTLNLDTLRRAEERRLEKATEAENERVERAEYERLRRKFEGT